VSPGCDNCYALRFAERFRGVSGHYFESGFDVQLREDMLRKPERWKKPRLVFVNSMSDLFHRSIPDGYITRVFDVMERIDRHIYQVLTKRPERLVRFVRNRYGEQRIPSHIWLGTSVENNAVAWRATMLRKVRADVRFLSVEPMLGPIDQVSLDGIAWVIVGGESGPGWRPLEKQWVQEVRDRCLESAIPFFFKQWHKARTGRLLDERTWDEMPLSTDSIRLGISRKKTRGLMAGKRRSVAL
jgi:protein gp37